MSVAITPIYGGILGLLLIALSMRVIHLRFRHRVGLGDDGRPDIRQAVRVHGNFIEYTPLALVLLLALELMRAPAPWLHGLGALLVAARLAHAWGLGGNEGLSIGRTAGVVGTFAVLLVSALGCLGFGFGLISP